MLHLLSLGFHKIATRKIAKDPEHRKERRRRLGIGPCLRWFLEFFTGSAQPLCPRVGCRMQDRTETLTVGSRAPEFLLSAANRDGILSLSGFLSREAL